MCDLGPPHDHKAFGYLVDTPEIRALIDETRRLTADVADTAARCEAMKPAFASLLAADGWLPDAYGAPDHASGMGGGIGQYALYRAQDGSLTLFSLVIPAGAETPVHDHLAWWRGGSSASTAAANGRRCTAASTMAAMRPAPTSKWRASRRSRPARSTRCCRRAMTSTS
jgi:hypothetical protein